MKKFILYSSIIFLFVSCNSKKDYTFQLHLEGIRFDSLILVASRDQVSDRLVGESKDGINWKFSIPDSVYRSTSNYILGPKLRGERQNIVHRLIFLSCINGDTLNFGGSIPIDHNIMSINAKFFDTAVRENAPVISPTSQEVFFSTLHIDRCIIPFYKDLDFEVRAYYPTFPYFPGPREYTNEEQITECLKIIKKYSNSRYLMGCIAMQRTRFNKENLQKLYTAFSKEAQQNDFGKIVGNHLKCYFVFSNMKLPRYDNNSLEFMIQDSTKMNLIVFSASWCVPCREEIPLLKEVYNDLKDRLDMTYISMNEEKTADNWRKLMKDEVIPWRSLMAKQDIKAVETTYNPSHAIPFTLLVYPDKTMEIIDIRQNDQKEKLYSVCNGSSK